MVSGATCSGRPVGAGSPAAGGPAGADDGGAAAGEGGVAEGPGGLGGGADEVAPAVVLGLVVVLALVAVLGLALLAVGPGAAELVEGAGAGGPKQAVRTIRPESPRTLNADNLGLVMMPP